MNFLTNISVRESYRIIPFPDGLLIRNINS